MSLDLYSLDKDIFLFLNRDHFPELDRIMFLSRDLLLWVPLILLSIFILFRYYENKMRPHSLTKTIIFSLFLILQVVLCIAILPHIFDFFIQRERPLYNADILQLVNLENFSFPEKEDFYSAKACAVAAISFFFISFYETPKWLKVSLLFWAVLISYNRIYIGAHYPFNILVSNLVGISIGVLTYRYYQYLKDSVIII